MDNSSSPLETLRQLKEMLDSGALTPTEFEALKQRLVLNPSTPLPPPAAPAEPAAPVPAVAPSVMLPPAPGVEQHSPMFEDVADEPPVATTPVAAATPVSAAVPAFAAEAARPEEADSTSIVEPKWTGDEFPAVTEEVPARNPLALILSIGGVLVFLAVVGYLTLNRPPSEHISSTSQTAADSLNTTIDTGPQAEPLPPTAAEPETVRIAPAHPAPALPSRSEMEQKAAAMRDSAESGAAPGVTDSTAR